MEKSISTDYSGFVAFLKEHCQAGATGCMFITSNNRSGRVILSDGEITNIAYANFHGKPAIIAIRALNKLVCRFSKVQTNFKLDESLPDTANILAELGDSSVVTSNGLPEKKLGTGQISPKDIEECLIEIIGPMGEFLCEDHLYGSDDISVAVKNIAAELSNNEKRNFLGLLMEKGYR